MTFLYLRFVPLAASVVYRLSYDQVAERVAHHMTTAPEITVNVDRMIPVSEANSRGVSKLASEAANGLDTLLLKGGRPIAWVVGMDKYRQMVAAQQQYENLLLMVQSLTRELADHTHPGPTLEDVLVEFAPPEAVQA